jgi:hypothetical protein
MNHWIAAVPCFLAGSLLVAAVVAAREAAAEDAPIATGRNATGVRIDVLSLRRTDGGTVTLRYAVVNDGQEGFLTNMLQVTLFDLANRRAYSPGIISDSFCGAEPGKRSTCWAVFAAPQDGVRQMQLKIPAGPGTPELIPVPMGP